MDILYWKVLNARLAYDVRKSLLINSSTALYDGNDRTFLNRSVCEWICIYKIHCYFVCLLLFIVCRWLDTNEFVNDFSEHESGQRFMHPQQKYVWTTYIMRYLISLSRLDIVDWLCLLLVTFCFTCLIAFYLWNEFCALGSIVMQNMLIFCSSRF